MDQSFKILLQLSRDFKSQGCYLHAAKCLDAASNCQQALPVDRALACLDYAHLLMNNFDNLDQAKTVLLRADRELRTVRGHYGLKCELQHHLLSCHRLLGDLSQALEACRSGLAASRDPHAKDLARWQLYFVLRMAECTLEKDKDPDAALTALDQANSISGLSPLDALSAKLCKAAINLQSRRTTDANDTLDACATSLEAEMTKGGADEEAISRLRVQYYLLYIANVITVGKSGQLYQDNDFPVFSELHQSLSESAGEEDDSWLPNMATAALTFILHGALERANGKGSAAAVQLGQAEELIDQALEHLNLNKNQPEDDVPRAVLANGGVFLKLKVALEEQHVLAALVSTDLSTAAMHFTQLMTMLQHYPNLFQPQIPSICMLLGHYYHTLGAYDTAISLYEAVTNSPAVKLHKFAALSAAMSELHRNNNEEGVNLAEEWVQRFDLLPANMQNDALGTHERSAAQLVNGMILRHKNDPKGARVLLTKALKQAHSQINNSQLTGQILNLLAPVQQDRQDYAGALQMFDSAVVILKSTGDLPSLVTALQGMCSLQKLEGTGLAVEPNQQGDRQQYLARKAAALTSRLEEAKASAKHAELGQAAQWLIGAVGGR